MLLAALGRAWVSPPVLQPKPFMLMNLRKKDVLVYHMWTQFYLDGQWVNLDAALGLVRCPADRITFTVDSMEEDTMESVIPVMELINNLKVTVQLSE